LDADRIVTFTGKINGDEIVFTWGKQVRDGGAPLPARGSLADADTGAYGMFDASTPPQFTAKRVPNGGAEFAAAVNLLQKGVKVEGTFFLPQNVNRVRSVIVVVNFGLGGAFYYDPQLRKLSETLESGLLHATISNIGQSGQTDVVRNAGVGGADGLLLLLERLAQESGHRELTDAPLLLWGHSAAGSFVSTFAALHPQRTIAFVRYHSAGAGLLDVNIKVLSQLPALLLVAGTDPQSGIRDAETSWKNGRSAGAPWTFAVEPDAKHGDPKDLDKANELLVPWITAVVRQRRPPDRKTLRAVTDGFGWMGNNRTGEGALYAAYPGSKAEASWLPDQASLRAWQTILGAAK